MALGAALLGALVPADHVRTTYTWPPKSLPAGEPSTAWYTPLLLIRREPDRISARLPCALSPPLSGAGKPVTVLATARFPERGSGFSVLRAGQRLVVRVGDDVLDRIPLSAGGTDEDCAYRLLLGDSRWSIEGGPDGGTAEGDLGATPVVNGLFSELDLRSGTPPSIEITTAVHSARTTVLQTIAWTFAAVGALAALLLVAIADRPRRARFDATLAVRRVARHARPSDGVVALALLVWWVLGPSYYDDGWVVARQSMFSSAGGFSNYYDSFGANHPLGYWLEWVQHLLVQETAAMLVLRVPALLCLAGMWMLCRWILARALASSVGKDQVALWALTSAFVVGAFAWGMTLRPEPEIALLATGVVVCVVRFIEVRTATPLAVAAVLVVLALAAHPSAIVALAPLVVVLPDVLRWARARKAATASIVTAAGALLVVLGSIGSDVWLRAADASSIRTYGNATANWREELTRYTDLFTPGYGTPLRRESVAFMVLAVLAFLMRSQRGRRLVLDIPTTSLGVALLLLFATPSKWPWHFGMLLGVASVALAAETARLRDQARRSPGWSIRPFLVIFAAVFAAAWSWWPRHMWSDLDLTTMEWVLAFESPLVNLSRLAGVVPLVLLAIAAVVALARGRRDRLPDIPWQVASWTAPVLAIPLIAFTVGVLIVDSARSDSWTLARQNLATLGGDTGCGLADDALVAASESMRSGGRSPQKDVGVAVPPWVPHPPLPGLKRFALGPVGPSVTSWSPWFELSPGRRIGVFVMGSPGPSGALELRWGRATGGRVERLGLEEVSALSDPEVRPDFVPWRFFPAAELPSRPLGANAARFALSADAPTGATVAITAPVSYVNERLVDRLEPAGSRTLVPPNLLTYVPCVVQPELRAGTVEMPDQVVGLRDSLWPIVGRETSPFEGILDLYRLERLPLADSAHPPGNVVLYEVDQRIPGAAIAPPDETTVVS